MENSPRLAEPPGISSCLSELDKELEKLTDEEEDRCVQLTWMTYDLVKLRTQMLSSAQELSEAWVRCRDAVMGDPGPQPEREDGAQDADSSETSTADGV